MDKGSLGARNQKAQERMIRSAETLAGTFGIDPAVVAGLNVAEKDPLVRAMKQREAVANLLEALASKGEVIQSLTVSVETGGEVQHIDPKFGHKGKGK